MRVFRKEQVFVRRCSQTTPGATDQGGGERRLVISRKSGAESEPVRAYTCVVELDAFNALSPPVSDSPEDGSGWHPAHRWEKRQGRRRPPKPGGGFAVCSTPTILERNAHSGNSGSLAIFAAIRRASSFVSSLAADRRPGSFSKIDIREN